MKKMQKTVQELGISKVKLAKYLGVSRQMVYNYLTLKSLDDWPKEKRMIFLELLGVDDSDGNGNERFDKLEVTTSLMQMVDAKLSTVVRKNNNIDDSFDLTGITKEGADLLGDIISILKEKVLSGGETNIATVKYVDYMLQSMNNVPEIKYILGYIAKTNGFVNPDEFVFDEDRQFIFEGILYSGLTLYNTGGASKSKVAESRRRFIQEIEQKREEKLYRTEQLNTITVQALRELGYEKIDDANAIEVYEKMAEIESRRM